MDTPEVLAGVRVLDPEHGRDEIMDVALEADGTVSLHRASVPPSGLWLMPGLVDLHVHLRTPGKGQAETLETGLKAAVAGGITTVGMMPNTSPPLDDPELVHRITALGNAMGLARVCPVPCVTIGRLGQETVDFRTFAENGVKAFSDDGSPVFSDDALIDAFRATSRFGGVIIEHPENTTEAGSGCINRGAVSLALGVPGIPESAEYSDVKRCIDLLRRSGADARLHLTHLSSPRSVEMVAEASDLGLGVSCDVTPHHISLDESCVARMGTLAKMNPPLRSSRSREELVELVRMGRVNAVASDHAPHDHSQKDLPLSEAAFGVTGLETLLPVTVDTLVNRALMEPLMVIRMLTSAPAGILCIRAPSITQGKPPEMVLFDPRAKWFYERSRSLSRNSPFMGTELTGRVLRVWRGRELYRDGEFV